MSTLLFSEAADGRRDGKLAAPGSRQAVRRARWHLYNCTCPRQMPL